jgi:hypothetical protein
MVDAHGNLLNHEYNSDNSNLPQDIAQLKKKLLSQ